MNNFIVPPEMNLIEHTRVSSIPKLSLRDAANKANISHTRWNQLTSGYKMIGKEKIQVDRIPANIVAQMAFAVNLKPSELSETTRDDAAELLQKIYSGKIRLKPARIHNKANRYRKFIKYVEDNVTKDEELSDEKKEKLMKVILDIIEYSKN